MTELTLTNYNRSPEEQKEEGGGEREKERHFLKLLGVFVCLVCVKEKAVVIWVWSGGHSQRGLEEYYSQLVGPTPLLLLLSLLHSADAPSSLEVFFPLGFLCRSAQLPYSQPSQRKWSKFTQSTPN